MCLKWISKKLKEGGRLTKCEVPGEDVGEVFRSDAKAEGYDVVVGGWECRGGKTPKEARWFSIRLTPQNCTWLHCRGEPYRIIAALELYATIFGILAFIPEGDASTGCGMVTGSAGTDNKGDMYAVSSMMSTKFPLNVLLMDFFFQNSLRGGTRGFGWTGPLANRMFKQTRCRSFTNLIRFGQAGGAGPGGSGLGGPAGAHRGRRRSGKRTRGA